MAIDTGASLIAFPRTAARAESLTVRDDRTGKTYVIPIEAGDIRATELNRPDEPSEHDLATRFVDAECPFSGPLRRREFDRKVTAYVVTGRSQP